MGYDELLNKGFMKRFRSSPAQVRNRMELVRRDMNAANAMMASDRDWAFTMAYNAILQVTRALMFAEVFRPGCGEGQHKVAVRFAEIALGETFRDEIYIFDKRCLRPHLEGEAQPAFDFAGRFVSEVETIIDERLAEGRDGEI